MTWWISCTDIEKQLKQSECQEWERKKKDAEAVIRPDERNSFIRPSGLEGDHPLQL
jgi:hypothetical protein